jgi:ribosomal protein S12 methylthiotransferase accessory factor
MTTQTVSAVRQYFAERIGAADQAAPVPDVELLGLTDQLGAGPAAAPTGPVFPIRLYGNMAILGPTYPGESGGSAQSSVDSAGFPTPCPRCLDRRWQVIRPVEERIALESGGTAVAAGTIPQLTTFALEAMWRIYLTARDLPTVAGQARVYALVLDTLRVSRHSLVADSDCPVCARPVADTAEDAVIELEPRAKRAVDSYREVGARDLDVPVNPFANPVCGALGSIPMRVHADTATAPVSGRFRVRSKYGLHDMGWGGHAGNYRDSEVIGVLEGLERFAGQRARGKRVDVFDSLDNLGGQALDPTGWATYPDDAYERLRVFYEPFRSDAVIPWVWAYSLRDSKPLLVAEQIAYFLDHRPTKKFVQESSNGCAGGSSTEEALLHGMLELIERDAFLLTWYGRAKLAEIDVATCRDQRVHFMIDRVGLVGYDVRLFDMRIDLPVPAVLAVAVRRGGGPGELCLSAGAGFDPEDAVRAAVCEVASYVPSLPRRVEKHADELHAMARDYALLTELEHHQLLFGLPEMARLADYLFEDPPLVGMDELYRSWLAERPATLDFADDVRYLVDRIATTTGSDVIAIDQTCPEQRVAGARTVGVIAPGLIPIDFGWLRQRAPHHPRLHAFLDGRLASGGEPGFTSTASGPNPHPHPFP